MSKKTIDVSKPVLTRSRTPYMEAKTDPNGKILVRETPDSEPVAKRGDQIGPKDEAIMEAVPIGRLLTMALDRPDEKMAPEERRKRFTLSCRIEDAILDGELFEFDDDDRKRIEAAADLVTNHFFLGRIYQALSDAEPIRKAKTNGKDKEAQEGAVAR